MFGERTGAEESSTFSAHTGQPPIPQASAEEKIKKKNGERVSLAAGEGNDRWKKVEDKSKAEKG